MNDATRKRLGLLIASKRKQWKDITGPANVSRQHIEEILKGSSDPTSTKLESLVVACGLSMEELYSDPLNNFKRDLDEEEHELLKMILTILRFGEPVYSGALKSNILAFEQATRLELEHHKLKRRPISKAAESTSKYRTKPGEARPASAGGKAGKKDAATG